MGIVFLLSVLVFSYIRKVILLFVFRKKKEILSSLKLFFKSSRELARCRSFIFSIFVTFMLKQSHVWLALTFVFHKQLYASYPESVQSSWLSLSAFWVGFLLIVRTATLIAFNSTKNVEVILLCSCKRNKCSYLFSPTKFPVHGLVMNCGGFFGHLLFAIMMG